MAVCPLPDNQPNPVTNALAEIKRLRAASEAAMEKFLDIQQRIVELEKKLEQKARREKGR